MTEKEILNKVNSNELTDEIQQEIRRALFYRRERLQEIVVKQRQKVKDCETDGRPVGVAIVFLKMFEASLLLNESAINVFVKEPWQ